MSHYDQTDDSLVDNRKIKAHGKIIWKTIWKNLYLNSRESGSLPENMDYFPVDL
jgi:hypothetical protein